MIKAWFFLSTGEAYDAVQCMPEIAQYDLLVIPHEKVVGIADTWPISVTNERGNLHSVKDWDNTFAEPDWKCAISNAREVAKELGYALDPTLPV